MECVREVRARHTMPVVINIIHKEDTDLWEMEGRQATARDLQVRVVCVREASLNIAELIIAAMLLDIDQ